MDGVELLQRITRSLDGCGLDIVKPFDTSLYNSKAKPIASLVDLPARSDGTGYPALLIANSKKLWGPFCDEYAQSESTLSSMDDPLDTYVSTCIERVLRNELGKDATRVKMFYSNEKAPDRLIAFQRLAHACNLAYLDESSHLCIHPIFGPWFALRAIAVFEFDNLSFPLIRDDDPFIPLVDIVGTRQLLEKALDATKKKEHESWRRWVETRDSISMGKEYRYSDDQVEYHYTKNRAVIQRLIKRQ